MLRLAYVVSQFPEAHESFITREVQAVCASEEVELTIFSLKHCRDSFIQENARPFLGRTHYPSLRASVRGLVSLLVSSRGRRCLGEIVRAYRGDPRELAKAIGTVVRSAALVPALRERRIERIHAHWATMPALGAYFLKRVYGVPYGITAHAWDIYKTQTMLQEKVASADFVVTCTDANRRFLEDLVGSDGRIVLSYHGLDYSSLPSPHFAREGEPSIVAVGRLVEQKGFVHLIEAVARLREKRRRLGCRIMGDGPLRSLLGREISRLGLEEAVRITGRVPLSEVFDAYRESALLCVPSVIAKDGDRDGIPNVILEAMSQGLPVVASDISGIPELVRDGETGWLVPPGDVSKLAEALEEAIDDREKARRRARAAYELVRARFDAARNARQLLELFRESRAAGSCWLPR